MVQSVGFCRHTSRESERFAIYAGAGIYLSCHSVSGGKAGSYSTVHFDGEERAAELDRHEAVKACHAARRAGVPAWLVQHPDTAAINRRMAGAMA